MHPSGICRTRQGPSGTLHWEQFRLSSHVLSSWDDCCKGYVRLIWQALLELRESLASCPICCLCQQGGAATPLCWQVLETWLSLTPGLASSLPSSNKRLGSCFFLLLGLLLRPSDCQAKVSAAWNSLYSWRYYARKLSRKRKTICDTSLEKWVCPW